MRAGQYVVLRLRRLPDPAHKISRGIAAGVFTSFTPLFGFHFLTAVTLAWLLRGNMLAALLATFVGNPLTFPIIATVSVELGSRMLGNPGGVPLHVVLSSFSYASLELWGNLKAIFTPELTHWGRMEYFFDLTTSSCPTLSAASFRVSSVRCCPISRRVRCWRLIRRRGSSG